MIMITRMITIMIMMMIIMIKLMSVFLYCDQEAESEAVEGEER